MWIYLVVFCCDLLIAYCSARFYMAMEERNRWKAVGWGMLLDAAIGVSAMGIVLRGWMMIPTSVLGGGIGTFAGLPRRKQELS